MKKYINISMFYFILGSIAGVFYREFTKLNNFKGQTSLSVIHVHLFSLGMLLFLLIALFVNAKKELLNNKNFNKFTIIYNIGILLFTITLLIRGIIQVKSYEITNTLNHIIAGVAGVSHILTTIGFIYLFLALRKEFNQ